MENQHRQITGYRDLSEEEILNMNVVKNAGQSLDAIVEMLHADPNTDKRWVSIGKTDLQTGIMALVRSIAKPTTFVLAGLLLLAGCSGGKYYQSWPMESDVNGDTYHYHNAVQLNLPATMFHATNSENWVEYCKTKIADPQTEAEFLYPFKDCKREEKYQLTTMGSVASQFVTPVLSTTIMAGGIVGAGYFIGDGLSKSGTKVQQNSNGNGNAQSSSHSKSDANANHLQNVGNTSKTTINHPTTNVNSNNVIKVK